MFVALLRKTAFTQAGVGMTLALAANCRSRDETATGHGTATATTATHAMAAAGSAAPRLAPQDSLGGIDSASVEPAPIAEKLCAALQVYPARRSAACCGAPPRSSLLDQCVRAVSASLRRGAVELDEEAVDACQRDMEQSLSGCDWVTPSQPMAPRACQGLFRGKLSGGSICRSSLECVKPLHCEGLGPTKTGVCAPPGQVGESCGAAADVLATYALERGLETTHPVCAEFCSLVTRKCSPLPEVGASCASAVNCGPSQTCVSGVCSSAAPAQAGEPCGACAAGLRCRQGACAPLSAPGQVCATDFDCAVGGCVKTADGQRTCGAKCFASLEAPDARAEAMRIPARPVAPSIR